MVDQVKAMDDGGVLFGGRCLARRLMMVSFLLAVGAGLYGCKEQQTTSSQSSSSSSASSSQSGGSSSSSSQNSRSQSGQSQSSQSGSRTMPGSQFPSGSQSMPGSQSPGASTGTSGSSGIETSVVINGVEMPTGNVGGVDPGSTPSPGSSGSQSSSQSGGESGSESGTESGNYGGSAYENDPYADPYSDPYSTGSAQAGGASGSSPMSDDEYVDVLEGRLDESVAVFDGMILDERNRVEEIEDAYSDPGFPGEEEPLFEEASLPGAGGDGEEGGDGESTIPAMPGGVISGEEEGEYDEQGNASSRRGIPGGVAKADIGVPADVGDGRDDDIVARQIREAAMKETDPVLREKLWDEYRKYKNQRVN